MINCIAYKGLLIQRLTLSIFSEHERMTYCRKSLTVKSARFHINVFSSEWLQPHVTLGVCSNHRGRAAGSAHIKGSQNLSNQNRPPAFSANGNAAWRPHAHCSVWKVYRLGCKVSAVCKPEPVGTTVPDLHPEAELRPPASAHAQTKQESFRNCQIEGLNWGRA